MEITSYNAAQRLQDDAAERCSMTYRAPELFNVQSPSTIDERTDIWVFYINTLKFLVFSYKLFTF